MDLLTEWTVRADLLPPLLKAIHPVVHSCSVLLQKKELFQFPSAATCCLSGRCVLTQPVPSRPFTNDVASMVHVAACLLGRSKSWVLVDASGISIFFSLVPAVEMK
jgi:hypothetical protein